MKRINEFSNSLDTMHKRPVEVIKRTERVINLSIIFFALIIFLSGGELISSLIFPFPVKMALKDLFRGEMPFVRRQMIMSMQLMKYLFIILAAVLLLEYLIPSVKSILYFSLK